MRVAKIPKRNGTFRTIVIPDSATKAALRTHLGALEAKAARLCPESVLHGFARGRSPVTNALAHVGHAYTVTMDLQDFFDSIRPDMLRAKLSKEELAACIIDPGDGKGPRPCQGLPTSPPIANIAAADMDRAILRAIDRGKRQVVYTRYADDLTLSCDDRDTCDWIMREIPQIIRRCGFRIAAHKTHRMAAQHGRRIITGIAVDDHAVHPTRATKRRLRAAQHQARLGIDGAANKARGLAEWAACKQPRLRPAAEPEKATKDTHAADAEALAKLWRLGRLPRLPEAIQAEVREGDYIITHDPAYLLGMSTYTTGWSSCMRQPDGQYRKGVLTWYALRGTSVAALLSTRTVTYAGVTRRVMRARCLVHRFRDGTVAYDRVYGDIESARMLIAWLEGRGVVLVAHVPKDQVVVGNVPRRLARPYCDSLAPHPMVAPGNRKVWVLRKK